METTFPREWPETSNFAEQFMAGAPKIEDCDRVLVVEGYSDLLFYAELLEFLDRYEGVFIKHFNGRDDLPTKLETFLTPQLLAAKASIGVVVDADTDAKTISNKLSKCLSELCGLAVIAGDWTTGTPRIGLFVAPDGQSAGEIETLVWKAWAGDPDNAQPKRCIEAYMDCMMNAGFTAQSRHKGLVSSLLAVRNDDDPRLGPGARTTRIFNFNRPEYDPLKRFLTGL